MMLACEKSVCDETTNGKKDARGLYDKPFPHYHSLGEIYATDRVVGANTGNADDDEEQVRLEDANVNQIEGEDETDVGPKLDGLVHALSTDINLTEVQEKLNCELSKMEFLAPMELFQVTNFLAKEHDLLRFFFNMFDERKSAYGMTSLFRLVMMVR
ncbi:unnamed protein product [Malus baccata var. baccata]